MSVRTPARDRQAKDTVTQPKLGPVGWARFLWRQLTSMRTALVLLMLLAVAAVPGSLWPQRSIDPVAVRQFLDDNPSLGRFLDTIGMFDVFASPWFAAIYLLLMVSLVGCLVPRSRLHWHAMRAQPPKTPRNLGRLPTHREVSLAAGPDEVLEATRAELRRRRYRVRASDPERPLELAAEAGYLKETGNLVFHISLLGLIVSVGLGHLLSWRGEFILAESDSFTSSVTRYDTIQAGPWVGDDDITPFSITLDSLDVTFETTASGAQFGQPRQFEGDVTWSPGPGQPAVTQQIAVNHPLEIDGTSVYLLGNGYAPVITVRDAAGKTIYSQPTPFLPRDSNYTSTGAIKVSGTEPELGFYGAFLPTLRFDDTLGPISDFPGLVEPGLVLGLYEGNLFPGGRPQSVYSLDVAEMTQVMGADGTPARLLLSPGETVQLPDGRGSITMNAVVRWAGLVARHDPGRLPALIWASTMLLGLITMLTVRRRRVFVRVTETGGGPGEGAAGTGAGGGRHTEMSIAGLAKGNDPGLGELIEAVTERIGERIGASAGAKPASDGRTSED